MEIRYFVKLVNSVRVVVLNVFSLEINVSGCVIDGSCIMVNFKFNWVREVIVMFISFYIMFIMLYFLE